MADNLTVAVIAAAAGVGGAVLGVVGGALNGRLQWVAAREARREEHQAQRDDLQRQTLIEFQEVLGRYVRALGQARHHDRQSMKATGALTQLPPGVSDALFDEGRRLRQLALRVRDDELRRRYRDFWEASTTLEVVGHPKVKDPDAFMLDTVIPAQTALEDRLGQVLRPLL